MCFIGKFIFNFQQKGPVNIDVNQLTVNEKNQLLYNYRRGVLLIDNPSELVDDTVRLPANSTNFQTPEEKPLSEKKTEDGEVILEDRELKLKKLLRQKISHINKEIPKMSLGELRDLLALEATLKNRKKLIAKIESIIASHASSVKKFVGNEPVNTRTNIPGTFYDKMYQMNEIEETEMEQIVLNPTSTED